MADDIKIVSTEQEKVIEGEGTQETIQYLPSDHLKFYSYLVTKLKEAEKVKELLATWAIFITEELGLDPATDRIDETGTIHRPAKVGEEVAAKLAAEAAAKAEVPAASVAG